jgi:hypothetical protein
VVASDKSNAIYTAFDRWLDTRNLSLIEKFTREELETALIECEMYKAMPPYLAMQSMVEHLKDIDRRRAGTRRSRTYSRGPSFREKLKWALIGALLSFVAALIIFIVFLIIGKHLFWF